MGLVAFVATGIWIFYNTKVLNTVRSENDQDRLQADYEKTYKKFEKQPEPRVTDVKYAIDLYPEIADMTMRGQQTDRQPDLAGPDRNSFHPGPTTKPRIDIPGAKLAQDDQRLLFQIYSLDPPMQPGESRVMHFTVKARNRGFENSLTNRAIVQNGTFIQQYQSCPRSATSPERIDGQEQTQEFRTQRKRSDAGARAELHRRLQGQLHQQ